MSSATRLLSVLPFLAILPACIAIPVGLGGEEPFTEEDLATMTKVKQAFGATENFNPCKILPTGIACGEGWKLSRLPSIPGAYL